MKKMIITLVLISLSQLVSAQMKIDGVWYGFFTYFNNQNQVDEPFTMVIKQNGSQITGTIIEPVLDERLNIPAYIANLNGAVKDKTITFAKTYNGQGGRTHTINYRLTLTENNAAFVGRWAINNQDGGEAIIFRMQLPAEIRRRAAALEAKQKRRAKRMEELRKLKNDPEQKFEEGSKH